MKNERAKNWAFVFLMTAFVVLLFGMPPLGFAAFAGIARILFFVFMGLFLVAMYAHVLRRSPKTS